MIICLSKEQILDEPADSQNHRALWNLHANCSMLPSMTRLILLRGFRRGLLNLRRSRGITVGAAALCWIVLLAQVFLVLGLSARKMHDTLATRNDFRLQLRLGATDRDVQQFLVAVRQTPSVSSVEYVTREKAMAVEMAAHPDVAALMEADVINPFHDVVIVTLGSPAAFEAFAAFVRHPKWSRAVDPITFASMETRKEEIQTLLRQAHAWSYAAFLLFAAAGVALLLTTIEHVRRSAAIRMGDLFVERVSGSEEASIILPFAAEMIVLLAIALFCSVACASLLMFAFPPIIPLFTEARILAMAYGPAVIVVEFAAIIVIGFTGAMLGVRRVQFSPHGSLAVI